MTIGRLLKIYGLSSLRLGKEGLLGSAVEGVASVFGSGMDASSQSSANETNLQIARETNEQQYKMFREQMDYNDRMWEKTNEYNSPVALAQRLRAAGINPSAVLQRAGGSSAVMQSAPSAPSLHTSTVEPVSWSPAMQGLSRAVDSYFENQNKDADLQMKKLELLFQSQDLENRMEKSIQELRKMKNDNKLSETQRNSIQKDIEEKEENLRVLRAVREDRIKAYGMQNDYQQAQSNLVRAQTNYQESLTRISKMNEEWLPKEKFQQFRESDARITQGFMMARAAGTSADAAKDSARAALNNSLKTDGITMSDEQRNEYISKKLDLMESEYQRNLRQGKSWFLQTLDTANDTRDYLNNLEDKNIGSKLPNGASSSYRDTHGRSYNVGRW